MNHLTIKAAICAIIGLGLFLVGYKVGSLSGDAEVSALKEKAAQEQKEAAVKLSLEVLANELGKAKLAKQTQDNLALIGKFSSPARVQLPSALCADYGQADTTGSSEQAGHSAGAILEEAGRIFSADRQRTEGIVKDCSVELEHCQGVKRWAAGLK